MGRQEKRQAYETLSPAEPCLFKLCWGGGGAAWASLLCRQWRRFMVTSGCLVVDLSVVLAATLRMSFWCRSSVQPDDNPRTYNVHALTMGIRMRHPNASPNRRASAQHNSISV